jgi:hypothetical protein
LWNNNCWALNILAVVCVWAACWGVAALGECVLASLNGTFWALSCFALLLNTLRLNTLGGAAASLAWAFAPDFTICSSITVSIDADHLCCGGADGCCMSSWSCCWLSHRCDCWLCWLGSHRMCCVSVCWMSIHMCNWGSE